MVELAVTNEELESALDLAQDLGVDNLLDLWNQPVDKRLALWVSLL